MKIRFIICLSILFVSISLSAQELYKKLPEDLASSKVLIVEYEYLGAEWKHHKRWRKIHNRKYEKWNLEIKEAFKEYPFDYEIIKLKDLDKYKSQDKVYILESDGDINVERQGKFYENDFSKVSNVETRSNSSISTNSLTGKPEFSVVHYGISYYYRFRDLNTEDRYYIPLGNDWLNKPMYRNFKRIIKFIKEEHNLK